MSIQVSFELSEGDIEHFRQVMKQAAENAGQLSQQEIIAKATSACEEMEKSDLPDFVASRMHSLEALITAVQDEEWQMPDDEKQDILASLAYFSEPHDLVPDHIPVLGYVDDAIMIELVIQDMSLDLEAYSQFCSFRKTEEARRGDAADVDRESWLEETRDQLRSTMRKRRKAGQRKRVFTRIM